MKNKSRAVRHEAHPTAMRARIYVAVVVLLGLTCLATADWRMEHQALFASCLAICIFTSGMKVNLPGVLGTMSVSFLFVLLGIQDLGAGQTMLIGCAGALVQYVWKPNGFRPVQTVFRLALFAVAIFSAHSFYHRPPAVQLSPGTRLSLIAASLIYFFLNTAAIALTERKSLVDTWRKCYFWSFPFYLVGASVAWVFTQDGADAEQFLAVADRRMHRAKQRVKIPRPAIASLDTPAFVTVQ